MNADGETLDGHYEAYTYVTSPVDQTWVERSGFASVADFNDFAQNMNSINLGRGASLWPDEFNGDFLLGRDYIIDARAQVTIPAGTWTVAINTDDGGQVTIPGAGFVDAYNQSDPFSKGGPDQIWYQDSRESGSTGASFTVGAGGLETLLHATMHQGTNADAFELVVRPGGPGDDAPQPGQGGWELLANGVHGWEVTPTDDLPTRGLNGLPLGSGVASPGLIMPGTAQLPLGDMIPNVAFSITTKDDGTTTEAGLHQRWYNLGSTGDLASQVAGIAATDTTSVRIQDEATWWSGSSTALTDIQKYPAAVATPLGVANDPNPDAGAYTAWLSGEINLAAGDTRFRAGFEDYKYVAIDTGGNGVAGDQTGEILFNDDYGVTSAASRDGGSLANVAVASVAADGWYKIDVIAAHDEGADAAVLYWDEGNEDVFPLAAPFNNNTNQFEATAYAVPSDKLRSVPRGDIEEAALVAGFEGAEINLEVSSALLDADRIVLRDASLTTVLDLSGATINISALEGEQLTEGDQWVLFAADSVIGLDAATINAPNGMDISAMVAGTSNRVTFGMATPGTGGPTDPPVDPPVDPPTGPAADIDGDGTVGFGDFLRLSANFGQPGLFADGDIDGDGSVGFGDFLTLSSTFGQSGGAVAAVPEPASHVLLAFSLLLLSQMRRRRR